uniref:dCMP deaminase n=1 Tax=Neogobius melanostomus TaxID=47308 RepID=A0A8C6U310_9GOBI
MDIGLHRDHSRSLSKYDHQFFMEVALLTAQKVGACIVRDGKIISTGYNHMPSGDENHTWARVGRITIFVCAKTDLKDATLYVTLFPSNRCAMEIIQAGDGDFILHQICVLYFDTYADAAWLTEVCVL